MVPLVVHAGSTPLTSAWTGLERSGVSMRRAAEQVLVASTGALRAGESSGGDTVTFSDEARRVAGASLEGGLLGEQEAALTYSANARVVHGVDSMLGTLLNVVA